MIAWLRLLRISLLPTLCADLAAGGALAGGAVGSSLRLLPISVALFLGGMALNARVDLEEDRRTRPDRPLPSGAVKPSSVTLFAGLSLLAGPAIGVILGDREVALWASGMATLIALYHSPLRRWGCLGPLILGTIRGANLALGSLPVLGLHGLGQVAFPIALYSLYVFGASLIAQQEDREPPSRANVHAGLFLALSSLLVWVVAVWVRSRVPADLRFSGLTVLLGLFLVSPVWRRLQDPRPLEETPGGIGALAGTLLGSMAWFTACLASGAGSLLAASIAVASLLLVRMLAPKIPPT